MAESSKISKSDQNLLNILTYNSKVARDFESIKAIVDSIDVYGNPGEEVERMKRVKRNADALIGRYQHSSDEGYQGLISFSVPDETIKLGFKDIPHFPLADRIGQAYIGEEIKRPLIATMIDTSDQATNEFREHKLKVIKEYMYRNKVKAIEDREYQKAMMSLSQSGQQITPQQLQAVQEGVQKAVDQQIPRSISNALKSRNILVSERQGTALIQHAIRTLNVKEVSKEVFTNAVSSDYGIIEVGLRHNKPMYRSVDAYGFTFGRSHLSRYVEDAQWTRRITYLRGTEVFNEFGDKLKPKHIKKLPALYTSLDKKHNAEAWAHTEGKVGTFDLWSGNPVDWTTNSQQFIDTAQNSVIFNKRYGLRCLEVTFRLLTKRKLVERMDRETGEITRHWRDNSYKLDPGKGDIKLFTYVMPEIWGAKKLGQGSDAIYIDIGPLPWQTNALDDPWDVKGKYYGTTYSTHTDTINPRSLMDIGFTWNLLWDIEHAKLIKNAAQSNGHLLLMSLHAKPKKWTWQQFFDSWFYTNTALIDTSGENFTAQDMNMIRSQQIGHAMDMISSMRMMEWIQDQCARGMYYPPERLGQLSPYATATGVQMNNVLTSNQSEPFHDTHKNVIQRSLNGLLDVYRVSYKKDRRRLLAVLDDMSRFEIEIDEFMEKRYRMGVIVSTDTNDFNSVQQIKRWVDYLIQNQMVDFEDLARLEMAKDMNTILGIAEEAVRKKEERDKAALEIQMNQDREKFEMSQQSDDKNFAREMQMLQERLKNNIEVADIRADVMHRSVDVDKNGVSDLLQRDKLNQAFKMKEMDKKFEQEKELILMKMREQPK